MKCTTTNESIDILTTNSEPVDTVVEYTIINKTSATTITPAAFQAELNTAGETQVVPPPASATIFHAVTGIYMKNVGTGPTTVSVMKDISSSNRELRTITLLPGESTQWTPETGWQDGPSAYKPIQSFTVHADGGANFTLTNLAIAERFALNTTRHLFLADLAGYTQVRLKVNKMVAGSAGAIFRAKYYSSYNVTVGNFLQLGLSAQVETSLAATGYFDSGWMDLATAARNNGICIGFTEVGGDATADPALGHTIIEFR